METEPELYNYRLVFDADDRTSEKMINEMRRMLEELKRKEREDPRRTLRTYQGKNPIYFTIGALRDFLEGGEIGVVEETDIPPFMNDSVKEPENTPEYHLRKLSEKFPDTMIELYGWEGYMDNLFVAYFKNGLMAVSYLAKPHHFF